MCLILIGTTSGGVIDVYYDLDPVISHNYYETGIPPETFVDDTIAFDLPNVTLNSGDTYRAHINLVDNKMLRIINSPDKIEYNATFQYGGSGGSPYSHNGTFTLNLLEYEDVTNTTQSVTPDCYTSSSNMIFYTGMYTPDFLLTNGEIINGSLLGDFIYEFAVPTSGVSVVNKTFSVHMFIKALNEHDAPDLPVVEVVPEPSTVLLLGLGGLILRIKQKYFKNQIK